MGVTLHINTGRYDAHVWLPNVNAASGVRRRGKQVFVGSWATIEPAVRAVAMARCALLGESLPPELAAHGPSLHGLNQTETVLYARANAGDEPAVTLAPPEREWRVVSPPPIYLCSTDILDIEFN